MSIAAIFDPPWYLVENPDVAAAAIDPLHHYLRHGRAEGRAPCRYFDPLWYRAAAAIETDPIAHYLAGGEAAGIRPSPHFDPAWYRATYAIASDASCLGHFLAHRMDGSVSPRPGFDAAFYLIVHPDVANAGFDPYEHYVRHGRDEGRLPMAELKLVETSGLFDENHYLLNAPDLLEAGVAALAHFCGRGWREGRAPNPYFDVAWYRATYPDRTHHNPLVDYIAHGERHGRRPGRWFEPEWYRSAYALADDVSPLRHWLEHRKTQRYSPRPDFDVDAYILANRHRMRPNRDPFLHALAQEALARHRRAASRDSNGRVANRSASLSR